MFFIISLILAIYLGFSEINSYGKLVPAGAITRNTKLISTVPLVIQRVASVSALSTIIEFFNRFDNLFSYLFLIIFMAMAAYFFVKGIILIYFIFLRIIMDHIDDNPKPF
ncbi:hypothetical protein P7H41_05455 [Vagococcus fluvialis]|uniref:hypothetical protein n=1 Tax=Vagococcus fluvialis TaxID=2738 RepID=UPI00288F0EF2|nr:hypothetical protein [Vagococcus fluvialis]MDT2781405.1 hypothetical protein [Vagococcus fluvialis]